MKMKSLRIKTTQSVTGNKSSPGNGDQKTNTERTNLRMYFPKSQKVLRKGTSLDDQTYCRKKDSHSLRSYNIRTKRRHSVDIVTVRSGEVTSTSTQTSHSKVTASKPDTKLKRVIIPNLSLLPKSHVTATSTIDPKPILKSTGSFTEKGTGNKSSMHDLEISDNTRNTLDIRFRYRLPERRQGALRKTVSFQEDIHRNQIKDNSRSRRLSSPALSLDSSDDMFEMDDLTDSLADM